MRYSEDLIQEVIARNNIAEVIGQFVTLKRSGSNLTGLCPFHNEKTPSFSVSEPKQMYYCFGCHAGGNVITFLMQYNNYTFKEALGYLADRVGITLPKVEETAEQRAASDKRSLLLEIHKKAAAFYYYQLKKPVGKRGYDYLTKRGLSDLTIRHFGLGYADAYGDSLYRYLKKDGYADLLLQESGLFLFDEKKGVSDKFWNRVMFPIMDERGRVIGFGGRVMGEGKPKYLNSPESSLFNKRRHLYALNYARRSRKKGIILCEGYMDVITMHQAGFDNAVASLGTALTQEQAALLKRFTDEVLLLYDSDNAGTMAALRAAPILRAAGIHSRIVRLSPYKDPDEFIKAEGAEAFGKRLNEAQNMFLFEADQIEQQYRQNDPAERTKFQHELAQKLRIFTEPMERDNYIEALASRFHLDRDAFRKMADGYLLQGGTAKTYQRPKSGKNEAKKENGMLTSQKLLLTYFANYEEAFGAASPYVSAEDFSDPLCKTLAEGIFRQEKENGIIKEANLLTMFTDAEVQQECAALFHTVVEVRNQEELNRAFTETVMRVIADGNQKRLAGWDGKDMAVFTNYIKKKKLIEEFEAGQHPLHISYEQSN